MKYFIRYGHYLEWLPTLLFTVIIIWQFLAGFRRGRSKSIKLFITFLSSILISVIFFYVVQKNFDTLAVEVSKNFGFSLKETFGTKSDYSSITGYFEEMLSNNEDILKTIEEYNLTITDAAKLIYSLALVGVNLILYDICILLFFVSKFILYIFYLIFAREGRRKKRINKMADIDTNLNPYNKHRFGGSIIGIIRGIIVSLFVFAPIGICSLLITNGESYEIDYDDDASDNTKYMAEIVRVVTKYDNVGVGKVLSSVKNKEGLPIYLIVADKLTTATYTYVDENGQEQVLELSLSKDISSLTRPIVKTAYLFLKYGYDTSKSNDAEYLSEFISSEKQIDGKTLQEAVNDTLKELTVDEHSMLGYACNLLAINLARNAVGSDVDETNIANQELANRLLYHAFLGENSIKVTDIISGNTAVAFNVYVDVCKYQDELNSLGKAFGNSTSQNNLVFGISRTVNEEQTTRGAEFAQMIYNDLAQLSFFNETRFNNLITDCLKDILSSYAPDYDFTISTNQNLYDINWTESISTIFTSFGALIDNVVNNNIESTDDLMHFYLNELANKDSAVYERVNNIVDSKALSIILNTNGFNSFISNTLNNSLNGLINENIVLPKAYWGTYENESGVVDGELKKIINSVLPTFAEIFNVSYNKDLNDEQIVQIMQIMCNPDSTIYDSIDTNKENHSVIIHSLISSLIENLNIKYGEDEIKIYYESSVKETLNSNGEDVTVISTTSLKEVLNFLYVNAEKVPSIQDGSVDFIELVKENNENVKNSSILLDLSTQLLYSFIGQNLEIPERLSLKDDVLENNITLWTNKESGEMIKILNIINNEMDIIKKATSESSDVNEIIASIAKIEDERIVNLVDSTIINATLTKKIASTTLGSNITIEIPNYAYNDTYYDTIKADEYVAIIHFIKYVYDIDDNTTTIDLNTLDYDKVLEDEGVELIKQSSIAVTSTSYWTYNTLSNEENLENYVDIPAIYSEDIASNKIKTDYESSLWKDELPYLLSNMHLLGVYIDTNNKASIELKEVFYLGDKIEDSDETKVDRLYKSTILKASLTKSLKTIDTLYLPQDVYDDDNYVSADACAQTLNSFKTLITVENLERSDFNVNNIKDYIDLSVYEGDKIDSLVEIVKPHIVTATFAKMIIDQDGDGFKLPSNYSFGNVTEVGIDETNLTSKWYNNTTSQGELVYLIKAINTIDSLSVITSDSMASISETSVLKAKDNMATLLESKIIWYTMSDKMFNVENLIITDNDATCDEYNEVYINKAEFEALVKALDVFASTDSEGNRDFENIKVDLETAYNNRELVKNSSIIRTRITEEISKVNTLVISRYASSEKVTQYYVNSYKVYVNKTLTNTTARQLVSDEIEYFLVGAKSIMGGESSYNINYNSIDLTTIDQNCLDSSIILNGLQTVLKAALAEADTSYIYYLSDDKINAEFITKEKAIERINELKGE